MTPYKEPLKDAPSNESNSVKKSKKVRSQSSIDMDDLKSAMDLNNHDNNNETDNKSSETTTTAQVGSIKSIQVHSKKTGIRITTHAKVTTNGSVAVNGHKEESKDETLASPTDEIYDIPKNFDGNKDDVFVASLMRRGDSGLGLGLIDGMVCS